MISVFLMKSSSNLIPAFSSGGVHGENGTKSESLEKASLSDDTPTQKHENVGKLAIILAQWKSVGFEVNGIDTKQKAFRSEKVLLYFRLLCNLLQGNEFHEERRKVAIVEYSQMLPFPNGCWTRANIF